MNIDNDTLALIQFAARRNGRWICAASFEGMDRFRIHRIFTQYHDYIEHMADRYSYDIRIRQHERYLPSRGTYTSWELSAVSRGWSPL